MSQTTMCPRLAADEGDVAHRETCLDCASLEQSRRTLRAAPAEPTTEDLRRLWAGIAAHDRAREGSPAHGRSRGLAPGLVGAALAAAIVAIAIGSRARGPGEVVAGRVQAGAESLEIGARVEGARRVVAVVPTAIEVEGARIEAEAQAAITLDVSGSLVRLEDGGARFVVAPEGELEVHTPHGRVRAAGAVVRVAVIAARTVVEVETGEADVRIAGGMRKVQAGERVAIEPAPAPVPAVATALGTSRPVDDRPAPEAAPSPAATADPMEHRAKGERSAAASPRVPAPPPAAQPIARAEPVSPPPELVRARAILSTDPAAARALTETVRAQRPPPAIEVEALMIESDAARRSHDLPGALALCARVIDHPSGEPFAEEAMLRAARIHVSLGQPAQATALLASARERFARGPLEPERETLAAKLARERGDLAAARAAIESVPLDGRSLPLAEERLALAEALAAHDPIAARALALPLTHTRWPSATRARATQVVDSTQGATQP